MNLRIPAGESSKHLMKIPHKACVKAIQKHWIVANDDSVRAQSFLWLFCWAKTGMNKDEARRVAREVFDEVFTVRFEDVDARLEHEYARSARYATGDIEADVRRRLAIDELHVHNSSKRL